MENSTHILNKWNKIFSNWTKEENQIKEVMREWLQENNSIKSYLPEAIYSKKNFSNYFLEVFIPQNIFGTSMKFKIDKHREKGFVTDVTVLIKEKYKSNLQINSSINIRLYSSEFPSPEKIMETYYALLNSYIELNDEDKIYNLWLDSK